MALFLIKHQNIGRNFEKIILALTLSLSFSSIAIETINVTGYRTPDMSYDDIQFILEIYDTSSDGLLAEIDYERIGHDRTSQLQRDQRDCLLERHSSDILNVEVTSGSDESNDRWMGGWDISVTASNSQGSITYLIPENENGGHMNRQDIRVTRSSGSIANHSSNCRDAQWSDYN